MAELRLVRPEERYRAQALEYIKEFQTRGSEIHGASGLDQFIENYDGWLEKLDADRVRKPNRERVPAETFFLMKQLHGKYRIWAGTDEMIVGMVNIRLALNDALWKFGGHIGYSIRPSERRQGYNKVNLYLALKICQRRGLEAVLLDCDRRNIASAKTIRALGGKLIRETEHKTETGLVPMQQYVIDVDHSLADYAYQYALYVSDLPE